MALTRLAVEMMKIVGLGYVLNAEQSEFPGGLDMGWGKRRNRVTF